MKHLLALAFALLPGLALAAEAQDPVRLSFERDFVREPITPSLRPALTEDDPLAEAIQAAVQADRNAVRANSALAPLGSQGG